MLPQDYREWMQAQGVERLDRVPSDMVPYYRLRAHRVDGVYAITVLEPWAGGPSFDDALARLGAAIAVGPSSPAWMGTPRPSRAALAPAQ